MADASTPEPEAQVRALYEQGEARTAQAFEELVSKPSFGGARISNGRFGSVRIANANPGNATAVRPPVRFGGAPQWGARQQFAQTMRVAPQQTFSRPMMAAPMAGRWGRGR